MLGMDMMLKSLGIQPEQIQAQVQAVVKGVDECQNEMQRQGRMMEAICHHLGLNPRDYDIAPSKEIEHEQR